MKAFIIDVAKCNGCYCCQIACKDEHVGNDWTPYAKPQPETGQFWLKLREHVRGSVPKVKMHYLPVLCMHCDQAPCISVCPVDGGVYKRGDGLVVIDPEKCTGCKSCVDACPYDVIYFNEHLNLAQKCTGCAHLLDGGHAIEVPRCEDACPTGALRLVEEVELGDLLDKAEVLDPASLAGTESHGVQPRVYYLNIPKRFVAGTVYDPIEKEVVVGATCTLRRGGDRWQTITDRYGDFWFKGLKEADDYLLHIEAAGFQLKTIAEISTVDDVNLGDVPLSR